MKTSCGIDRIPIHIVKATIGNIAKIVSVLVNCSLSTGVVKCQSKNWQNLSGV